MKGKINSSGLMIATFPSGMSDFLRDMVQRLELSQFLLVNTVAGETCTWPTICSTALPPRSGHRDLVLPLPLELAKKFLLSGKTPQ